MRPLHTGFKYAPGGPFRNMKNDRRVSETLAPQTAYDQWAEEYDDADPTTLLDEPFLLSMLKLFDGCRVLDIGCGTGRYVRQAAQPGVTVVGVDLSRAMLARARRGITPEASVSWVQASVADLPFSQGAFDRVISGLVLDHVDDLHGFFLQVAETLRPGGRLIMSAIHPDMQRLTGSVVRFTSAGREYRTHGIVHEVRSIAEAVQQSGLTPECLLEPPVDQELVARRPAWSNRLGCPALVLLAAQRPRSVSPGASQRIES
jgi:2-polyprenyl-3-methyl-5-hydroxy-6-metoxy-1,4-benzoquinol methylase